MASIEPVRLRQRKLSTGNTSLYLDIYVDGKRTYEYLKLYLIPETNRKSKEENKQTLLLAEAIRAKRLVEVRNGKYGFENQFKQDTKVLDFYCSQYKGQEKTMNRGSLNIWQSAYRYLEAYCKPDTTFRDVTAQWIEGFLHFLETTNRMHGNEEVNSPISRNSSIAYYHKLCLTIRRAYECGIIPTNPLLGLEHPKKDEVEKPYLTLEEVRQMAATECDYPALKRAFLFSCLTGLRKSDIVKMRWSEVRQQGEYTRIVFRQKKTGGQEYIDITPEAVQFLGERGADDALVFAGFHYSSYLLLKLKAWALASGITKPITFHSGRHTFAVLMLDLETDIYTVQKLLGHKSIATTMVYAAIMDKKKQEAVSRIPSINIGGKK